jgi:hypothetical protein
MKIIHVCVNPVYIHIEGETFSLTCHLKNWKKLHLKRSKLICLNFKAVGLKCDFVTVGLNLSDECFWGPFTWKRLFVLNLLQMVTNQTQLCTVDSLKFCDSVWLIVWLLGCALPVCLLCIWCVTCQELFLLLSLGDTLLFVVTDRFIIFLFWY